MTALRATLADRGPLSRKDLREALAESGARVDGQAFYHLLFLAALHGQVVVGPIGGDGRPGVALTRDWLGEEPALPLEGVARDRALAELARRYLLGHGPASDRDLAWWAGLPLRDARRGLGAIEPVETDDVPDAIPPRLLPMWDAYLLGWKERGFLIAGGHMKRVFNEGVIGPAVTVDGRAVGTWAAPKRKGKLAPEVEAFGRVPKRALQAELADLARFEEAELA